MGSRLFKLFFCLTLYAYTLTHFTLCYAGQLKFDGVPVDITTADKLLYLQVGGTTGGSEFEGYAQWNKINERVSSLFYCGDRYTSGSVQKPKIQGRPIASTFLITSHFSGLDKYASSQECDTTDIQGDPQSDLKFFEEITRQSNSKNRLSQISDYLRDKLPSNIIYDHLYGVYHILKSLSMLLTVNLGGSYELKVI